ncbi:MAG: HYExAFE family protein [Thermogemmata sp.]|jgi:hypothetical protein|nr:HYExAFE family protein [Gemmataceae bacterium]GIW85323.1 MAG: hypothetical protein KatS3mg107_0983 [Gemmataceae bacterium]
MKRNNLYEQAFAAWARRWGAVVLPLAEIHRQPFPNGPLKTPDFLVLGQGGPEGARLVVDVKGRRFGGTQDHPRSEWPNWCHASDLEALPSWAAHLGPSFRPVLAFVYALADHAVLPPGTPDLFRFRDQCYLMRGVDVYAYRQHMRPRSTRWQTVFLSRSDFRHLVRPFSWFLDDSLEHRTSADDDATPSEPFLPPPDVSRRRQEPAETNGQETARVRGQLE